MDQENEGSEMKPGYKRLLIAAALIALLFLIRSFGLDRFLTLESFRQYRNLLVTMTADHYIPAVVIYIAVYIAVTALSVPGATLLTLTGGFLFGFFGVVYVNIGATTGALFSFLVARYLIGDWIQNRYGKRFEAFNQEVAENGYHYLLTLRLIPLFPFFLINIFAGLTRIPLSTYIWTTMIGIAPASFVYVYAGRELNGIEQAGDILSWRIILAFILLGLLVLSPVLLRKILRRKKSEKSQDSSIK